MPLVATDAIVLHAADYLETSRILRLLTRELGVVTVVARGARRSRARFGAAVDLFAQGVAHIEAKSGRDMHTLTGFDVTDAHATIASAMARFAAASALTECVQRIVTEEQASAAFDIVARALRQLETQEPSRGDDVVLGAVWALVAELGLAPTLTRCASCNAEIPADEPAPFSHAVGGVVCPRCAGAVPATRRLPPEPRRVIARWMAGGASEAAPHAEQAGRRAAEAPLAPAEVKAHQRLLREYLGQHLVDPRRLSAWHVWESSALGDATSGTDAG